jgi:hypothetical protein
VILFGITGPWLWESFPTATWPDRGSNVAAIAISAFLAWWVTRGSALARGLMILYTIAAIASLLSSYGMTSGDLASLGLLISYLAELALLVSMPVYNRTRKRQRDTAVDEPRAWALPPKWLAVTAVAAGVILTVAALGGSSFRSVPGCQAPGYLAPHSASLNQCTTLVEGYPVPYLSAVPGLNLDSGNKVTPANLDLSATPLISRGAAAEDLGIWILISFAALYLLWVPSQRPAGSAAIREPIPA